MADINPLTVFASAGERNTDGLTQANGFPSAQKPARQWFNWLFHSVTTKINELVTAVNTIVNTPKDQPIKVGDIYLTTINHTNAAAVAAHHGYGTWEPTGGGTYLSLAGTSDGVTLVGGIVSGSHRHTITIDEMPAHSHRLNWSGSDDGGGNYPEMANNLPNTGDDANTISIQQEGGGAAMPIRPRTTTYYGWVRVADPE